VDPRSEELSAQLARVALGDRAAFARVYEMTHAHLFSLAQRILSDRQWAEDVLQESFVNVWKNASGYNASVSQPMTWLISIVRNRCLDALRAQGRRVQLVSNSPEQNEESGDSRISDVADESASPLELLDAASDALHVRGCMDTLDARVRQSLALAYYQGMSNSEVAEHLGSPLGSVKTWLRRGLQQLRLCIESVAGERGTERSAR
jgi:RNA polymerase sigma-70 factor, ECF subfamily